MLGGSTTEKLRLAYFNMEYGEAGARHPGNAIRSGLKKMYVFEPTTSKLTTKNWRFQATELGIHTVELQNLQRLTPGVFRSTHKAGWSVTCDGNFPSNNATDQNTRYCLDHAVPIALKKKENACARCKPTMDVIRSTYSLNWPSGLRKDIDAVQSRSCRSKRLFILYSKDSWWL